MTWDPAVLVTQGRGRRLVDAAVVVSVVFALAAAVSGGVRGSVRSVLALVGVAVWCTGWAVVRRGTETRRPLWLLAAGVLGTAATGTAGSVGLGFLGLTPFLLALLVGSVWSVSYVVGSALVLSVLMGFLLERSPTVAVQLFVLVLGVTGVPWLLGWMTRTVGRSRARADALNRDLRDANHRLRSSLATQSELVLAEERARQSRELHDGIGHQLTLVALSLEFAQRTRERDPAAAWEEVARAAATNQQTLKDVRLWVRALNPPAVRGEVGGAEAFESIAAPFRGTGLDVVVRHEGDDRPLPDEVALFATRFVQEGLTNVLKHADAQRVDVQVVQSPAQLRLSVRDDGAGTGGSGEADGFGLRSLRERVELLGGTLSAQTVAGDGFRLVAVLPLVQQTER